MQVVHTFPEHEAVCKMMQGGAIPTLTVQLTPKICREHCSLYCVDIQE